MAGPPGFGGRSDRVAIVQGAYYLATALWPLVSMRSFEAVTGRKTDKWLVRTVATLVGAVGLTLLVGGSRQRASSELALLAIASAAGLGAIDVLYAKRGRISRVYLLDAAAEAALTGAWGHALGPLIHDDAATRAVG